MYDYKDAMREDIINHFAWEYSVAELLEQLDDPERFKEQLTDDLWIDDSITGNASGSYFCNSWKSLEAVTGNMDLLGYMVCEWDIDAKTIGEKFIDGDWEWFDVSIRCYLLGEVVAELVDDLCQCIDAIKAESNLTSESLNNILEAA